MDSGKMKNNAVDSGALAKAALAAVMPKPETTNPATTPEFLSLQAELAALKAKLGASGPAPSGPAPSGPKKASVVKATKGAELKGFVASAGLFPMSVEAAKKYVAKFLGKKGRRPAAFYEAQKIIGAAGTEAAATKPVKSTNVGSQPKAAVGPTGSMTFEAAQKYVASFAGKKGRRPAAFYEAQKIVGVSAEADVAAGAADVVVKGAKGAAKTKVAGKAAKSPATKKSPGTGQSGSAIKNLTAEDLNPNETALMLALGTEGHRLPKSIKDLAAECFPHKKKAQANSWARNGLRRLVRAKLVERGARGVFKQSIEGRNLAKKLSEAK
jgi:hypothetical protein